MKVIDHENIQDGHHTDWDEQEMLRILTAETRANAIDTVRHPWVRAAAATCCGITCCSHGLPLLLLLSVNKVQLCTRG